MNKRIPVATAKEVAKKHGLAQVILVCWEVDEKQRCAMTHVVTYGKTKEDCLQAATGGNMVKKALGWPDSLCNTEPSRMKGKIIIDRSALTEIRKQTERCSFSSDPEHQLKVFEDALEKINGLITPLLKEK